MRHPLSACFHLHTFLRLSIHLLRLPFPLGLRSHCCHVNGTRPVQRITRTPPVRSCLLPVEASTFSSLPTTLMSLPSLRLATRQRIPVCCVLLSLLVTISMRSPQSSLLSCVVIPTAPPSPPAVTVPPTIGGGVTSTAAASAAAAATAAATSAFHSFFFYCNTALG